MTLFHLIKLISPKLFLSIILPVYAMHKTTTMAAFDLQIPVDNMSCIWLKGRHASDYQQTGWQIFETSLTFPSISQVSCYLKSSTLRALRSCLGDFSTCNRFPYHQNTINQWFAISSEGGL